MSNFDQRVREVVAAEIRDLHELFQPGQAPVSESKVDLAPLVKQVLALRSELHSNCSMLEDYITQQMDDDKDNPSKARKVWEFIKRVFTELGDTDGDNDFDLSDVRNHVEKIADEIGDITRDIISTGINLIQTERLRWTLDKLYDKILHDENRDETQFQLMNQQFNRIKEDEQAQFKQMMDAIQNLSPERGTSMTGAILSKLSELETQVSDIRRALRQAAYDSTSSGSD